MIRSCSLMFLWFMAAALTVCPAQGERSSSVHPIDPEAKTFEAWKNHILPSEEESAFEKIDWLPSFAAGLQKSREENRPFLFYAMNGHPLGCT